MDKQLIFKIICDELHLTKYEKEKIKCGEKSDVEATLENVKDKCCMAWIVLATSSLLDESNSYALPQDTLETMMTRIGYTVVSLNNIMRNSSSITSATAPDHIHEYGVINIKKIIRKSLENYYFMILNPRIEESSNRVPNRGE